MLKKKCRTLVFGSYKEYFADSREIYMYERALGSHRWLIVCSFSKHPVAVRFPKQYASRPNQLILSNYTETDKNNMTFRPYEARVYRFPPSERGKERTD